MFLPVLAYFVTPPLFHSTGITRAWLVATMEYLNQNFALHYIHSSTANCVIVSECDAVVTFPISTPIFNRTTNEIMHLQYPHYSPSHVLKHTLFTNSVTYFAFLSHFEGLKSVTAE